MFGRYIGRLVITNDNFQDFHNYVNAYESIGFTVLKVKTNKKEYFSYLSFIEDIVPNTRLKTIHVVLHKNNGKETIEFFNRRFNTRTWYMKENTIQEYDPDVKKQENHTLGKAIKGINLFQYKERDVAQGKDLFDLVWIMPIVGLLHYWIVGSMDMYYPIIIMLTLFLVMKARLAMYNVLKID